MEAGEADWVWWGMRRGGVSAEEAAGDGVRCGGGPATARRSVVGGWVWLRREKMAQQASRRADETSG